MGFLLGKGTSFCSLSPGQHKPSGAGEYSRDTRLTDAKFEGTTGLRSDPDPDPNEMQWQPQHQHHQLHANSGSSQERPNPSPRNDSLTFSLTTLSLLVRFLSVSFSLSLSLSLSPALCLDLIPGVEKRKPHHSSECSYKIFLGSGEISMAMLESHNPLIGEITCGSLLQKLQDIWDEVGETEEEREKMLLRIEQECLEVYKSKVELAETSRAQLLQTLSDAKLELSSLLSAVGEKSVPNMPEQPSETIKDQLAAIAPALEQLLKQRDERVKEFSDVLLQIQKIGGEIAGTVSMKDQCPEVDESDLTSKRLNGYKSHLQDLQREKSDRLEKVHDFVRTVHDLCTVLGIDFFSTVSEVHPSLNNSTEANSKSISNDTLSRLANTVATLKEDKKQRLQKLQALASQLIDLWNLMDTPEEDRRLFDHVTCNMSASADDVTASGALALDLIEQAEVEVERLDLQKASRMKEIAFKKQTELEEIFALAHIEIDPEAARERLTEVIDSGTVEPAELIADMDSRISKAKEEALSRREILDKVEKWMCACEEESWLDDYNRDDNRYNTSRGAHLNLKRAEKARVLVSKIPGMVNTLIAKIHSWEEERGLSFVYDGVPLLAMLDEYSLLRQEREEERRRFKDQKKHQDQQSTEQEAIFGTKSSPVKPSVGKKANSNSPRTNGGSNGASHGKRLSLNSSGNGNKPAGRRDSMKAAAATSKDDTSSHVSSNEPVLASP
ncbi:hypothetical protein MLD38_012746 [Melastoma candidum]|uniref:Uncharacterized protein n=1 Tax=Melastoma candidum TaxID=119954 RepID=A0ACB9RBI8_9MYRT|nr:hypothetical protein MLD38_012746 [Melastoma candidum]